MHSGSALRRGVVAGLALLLALLAASGPAAARPAPPRPNTQPGGLLPGGRRPAAAQDVPTCVQENVCTIVKDTSNEDPSCTGYSSQTTPPATIRVLVRTGNQVGTYTITDVPFKQYVENVLPDEWVSTYDGDALKAGAVAVKSYGWYWATHYGGYMGKTRSAASCFDVTDDYLFQTYLPGSATARTTTAVEQAWPVTARKNGQVLQASYQSYLNNPNESCGAGANGSVMSQVGTQACIDADLNRGGSTGNKYNVILAKYYYPGLQLATARQLRTPNDFSFEQTSSRAFFAAGTWMISDGYGTTFRFGTSGDTPTVRNDGDGFAHLGVFRPSTGTWYEGTPSGGVESSVHFGQSGDVPVQAHYAGVDKPTTVAVWRPSTGTWFLGPGGRVVQYGARGDIPVPGAWTGTAANDYADTIAVFRPSTGTWYRPGAAAVRFGRSGDIPCPADYDGTGVTDIAVYRPSTHTFSVRHANGTVTSLRFGAAGDVPVTGDYNGDGRADLAVYRPSNRTWYVNGQAAHTFGQPSGTPIGKSPQY